MGQEVVEGSGRRGTDAAEDVGEIGDGLDGVGFAGGGEGVEAGDVGAGLLVPHEEKVLTAESRSVVILLMSDFARASRIRGTRRSTLKSTSSTRRRGEASESTSA